MKFRFIPHFPWWAQIIPWVFIPLGAFSALIANTTTMSKGALLMGATGLSLFLWAIFAMGDRLLRTASGVRVDSEGLVRIWWRDDMFVFPKEALTTIRVKPVDSLRETWTFVQRNGHKRDVTLPRMSKIVKKQFYAALKHEG